MVSARRLVRVLGYTTMRSRIVLFSLLVALGGLAVTAGPTFGQSAETSVTATLRIASACLTVSPNTVDFGTLELTQPGIAPAPATATVVLRNCSAQSETVLVRGSAAMASGNGLAAATPAWNLASGSNVCAGPNLFLQGIRDSARVEKQITAADQLLKPLPAGATESLVLTLVPPCAGSIGAGQTISVRYSFTATLLEQTPQANPR